MGKRGQAAEHSPFGLPFFEQALPDSFEKGCGDGYERVRPRIIVNPAAFTDRVKKSARLQGTEAKAGLVWREADCGSGFADCAAGGRQDGFQAGQPPGVGQDPAGSPEGWMETHTFHTFQYVEVCHATASAVNGFNMADVS